MRWGTHRSVAVFAGLATSCLVVAGVAFGQVTEGMGEFRTPWGDPDFSGIWNNNTITIFNNNYPNCLFFFFTCCKSRA